MFKFSIYYDDILYVLEKKAPNTFYLRDIDMDRFTKIVKPLVCENLKYLVIFINLELTIISVTINSFYKPLHTHEKMQN